MLRIVAAGFIVLHGLVHLLYVGQSQRLFELQPGMIWPKGSWLFSNFLGNQVTRWLASAAGLAAAVGFVAGGVGLLVEGAWWNEMLVASALLSVLIVVLFWNGRLERLADQGLIALVIDVVMLAILLVVDRSPFAG